MSYDDIHRQSMKDAIMIGITLIIAIIMVVGLWKFYGYTDKMREEKDGITRNTLVRPDTFILIDKKTGQELVESSDVNPVVGLSTSGKMVFGAASSTSVRAENAYYVTIKSIEQPDDVFTIKVDEDEYVSFVIGKKYKLYRSTRWKRFSTLKEVK